MQRLPERQRTPMRSAHARARTRRRAPAGLARWLITLGVVSTLAGVGLVIGLGRKPAVHPAPKAAARPVPQAAPVLDQADFVPRTFREHAVVPTSAAPVRPPSASASPSAAASHPAPASPAPAPVTAAGAPAPTAEYQTPRGANQLAWSEAILTALGDPQTAANIVSIGYWMQNEAGTPPHGIVGANNPINVSQPGFGGWPIKSEGGGYNLYSYPSPQAGIQALVAYLTPTGYPQILAALKSGAGLSSPSLGGELSEYSGGGYTTIPDTWGASQGQPES
jgi:hypothetical protein